MRLAPRKGIMEKTKLRFEKFTLLIDGIHKNINRIKVDTAPTFGVKGVHVLWVYELLMNPQGLTATELAARSMVNRSLVSREIEELKRGGYIASTNESSTRYNEKFSLTESGRSLADKICKEILFVQDSVNTGISEEELASFYSTLQKLNTNFEKLAKSNRKRRKSNEE